MDAAWVCPSCRFDLSEVDDPDAPCPLCAGHERFADARAFEAALRRFAAEPDDARFHEFMVGTFVTADVAALYARYQRGEVLEAVYDPFSRAQRVHHTEGPRSERAGRSERVPAVPLVAATDDVPVQRFSNSVRPPSPVDESALAWVSALANDAQPTPPGAAAGAPSAVATAVSARGQAGPAAPRAVLYPLASVAAADGIVDVEERWYLDECLKRMGLGPATDAEIAVYFPLDYAPLVPPAFREELVTDMCALAMIDGLPDAAEARMIYAYCAEWRIPEERARELLLALQRKNTSLARRAWVGFRNYLLPGRWENTKL
jgi:uncharacterized membrane protein YebE (DUF533 family)